MIEPMASIALKAARAGAQHIARCYDRPDLIKISSDANEVFTNVNEEVKNIIIGSLSDKYPEHVFPNGELDNETKEYEWLISPLDGSENFASQIPHFSISIACAHKGKLIHGVIVDPMRQEEFVASRGSGATLNGKRIRVGASLELKNGSVAGPLLSSNDGKQLEGKLSDFGVKRYNLGSIALDLAYVAAGKLDTLWRKTADKHSIAAGILLVREAGGLCADFSGGLNHYESGNIVAGNQKCLKDLCSLTRKLLV